MLALREFRKNSSIKTGLWFPRIDDLTSYDRKFVSGV
jgi:hypothetical protein